MQVWSLSSILVVVVYLVIGDANVSERLRVAASRRMTLMQCLPEQESR